MFFHLREFSDFEEEHYDQKKYMEEILIRNLRENPPQTNYFLLGKYAREIPEIMPEYICGLIEGRHFGILREMNFPKISSFLLYEKITIWERLTCDEFEFIESIIEEPVQNHTTSKEYIKYITKLSGRASTTDEKIDLLIQCGRIEIIGLAVSKLYEHREKISLLDFVKFMTIINSTNILGVYKCYGKLFENNLLNFPSSLPDAKYIILFLGIKMETKKIISKKIIQYAYNIRDTYEFLKMFSRDMNSRNWNYLSKVYSF